MGSTVNILLFRSKTSADGSHPLMIRVCINNKKKYKSLGISIKAQFWDFEKNKPKRNCPNRESIQTIILEKTKEYSEQLLELHLENKEFTATKLIEKVTNPNTIKDFIDVEIIRLQVEKRYRYAYTDKDLKSSLLEFNKHLDIYFSEIDQIWLSQYEAFLRAKGLKNNSICQIKS